MLIIYTSLTAGFVAPEIFAARANEGYNSNVDVFSCGAVLYTALCGYEPFYGECEAELIEANKLGIFEFHMPEWSSVAEDAKDLVAQLMERNPAQRLTPQQALQHPWLARHAESTCSASSSSATSGSSSSTGSSSVDGCCCM
jgi:serine/threonine protein kinase